MIQGPSCTCASGCLDAEPVCGLVVILTSIRRPPELSWIDAMQKLTIPFVLSLATVLGIETSSVAGPAEDAREILDRAGIVGGIVVHLGCGDGMLTEALRGNDSLTVHGLDADPAMVTAARKRIAANGNYGPVSIDRLPKERLPYGRDLINLIFDDAKSVSQAELMRVLTPGGVLLRRDGSAWKTSVKPRPDDIDEWSHFLHDAGGNPVAADEQVGPPRSLRWIAPPLWLRSHETPSGIQGMVSAGGRIFYYFDEGIVGVTDQRLPEQWSLICRDAFNGRELWRRSLDEWGWPAWAADQFASEDWIKIRGGRTVVPNINHRRIVASADRLFTTLSYEAPLSILDAQTGKVLHTVENTEPVRELVFSDGLVVTHTRDELAERDKRRGRTNESPSILTAVDAESGAIVWQVESEPLAGQSVGATKGQAFALAVNEDRVITLTSENLEARDLRSGDSIWSIPCPESTKNLVAHGGFVLIYAGDSLIGLDGKTGERVWENGLTQPGAKAATDLFVSKGIAYRGMVQMDDDRNLVRKSKEASGAMVLGFDLKTGEEKKRIIVDGLLSPEHHHRCYTNKATDRYIISGMEGAEFMDLVGDDHGQNNFVRGACKQGVMPCNGMVYVPADQCFCQPGAKLLGFSALGPETEHSPVRDDQRVERGPAWDDVPPAHEPSDVDWPTFRHDTARHGTSPSTIPFKVSIDWEVPLGGRLTQPIAVGDRVFVADRDAHTVHAVDAESGRKLWSYIAGGRIDSPPTWYNGTLLFGSADGRVYCLRADDGELVWRFLAAPEDRRVGYFDQLESAWPVHGSILVRDGLAYATAGRSTYLDGGIRVFALDAATGDVAYKTILDGPHRTVGKDRDKAFFIEGANSDVLVSEGNHIFMRQKKMSLELNQIDIPILSSKGAQDVGLHMFSTASLLDDSGYNRTFWMYAQRWPGFQIANQAPKAGKLLVTDANHTFGIKQFTRRNVHSPMYFPGQDGYLVFADFNTTEPQIVGEPGSKAAVEWLPQSHIPRDGNPDIQSQAFGQDKKIGYTRAEPPVWTKFVRIRAQAMVKSADFLFVAGEPDNFDENDPLASFEGREGARLASLSATTGEVMHEISLAVSPIFDGLIAANGRLFAALEDGTLVALK